MNPLFYLILAPTIYALVNIIDKYVISHKIVSAKSYTMVVAFAHLLIGGVLFALLPWKGTEAKDLIVPIVVGLLYGIQLIIYVDLFTKEDASNIVGIDYSYPLVTAFFSFLFLNEKLSLLGYFAMILIILGVFLISKRMNEIKFTAKIWVLIAMVFTTGIYEFFIKIGVTKMPEINGLALNSIFAGICVLIFLTNKKTIKLLKKEIKNFKYAITIESITVSSIFFIFLAMTHYKASVVASISAIQPLIVLFGERILSFWHKKMTKDTLILPKLKGIALIVIGVIILTVLEIV